MMIVWLGAVFQGRPQKTKPVAIVVFKEFKIGVDKSDQTSSYCSL
jgi:hypothetical protein